MEKYIMHWNDNIFSQTCKSKQKYKS